MIDEKFVLLGAALNLIGTFSYLKSTIKGETKPNKVTWFLWALAPLIAFAAQITQGVGLLSLMTFMVGFGPLLIFVGSFVNKKAEWKITKFDIFCGTLSIIGLALWAVTKDGNTAILFAILADSLAAVPTLIKSFKLPETENYKAFLFAGINASIALLTIKQWDFANYAFPVYVLFICVILFLLIRFEIGKKIRI